MGEVYLAHDGQLQRPVALKVLSAAVRTDDDLRKRLEYEARAASALNHPNILTVYDVGQIGEEHFIATEYVDGVTLRQRMTRGEPPLSETIHIAVQIASALSAAEAAGLVHRDVKPDNILVNEEGIYKLADLGIAAPIAENGVATQERIFGSPHYVAPEQARGGAIDGRADLYALGASAFHLLTGKTVFTGTNRQVVVAHISTPPPDLGKLVPQASDDLVELVMELLEKDPDDRPENADEVAERIEELLKQPQKPRAASMPRRVKRVRRRRRYRS